MPRRKLTQSLVGKVQAEPGAERTIYWDESLESFGLMVTAAGARSFVVQYRANGASRRFTIKSQQVAKARKAARSILGRVADGADPVLERRKAKGEATNTLRAVAEDYLRREERRKQLRSIGERRRIFERYVYPKLGARQIDSIKRSDIVRLLEYDGRGEVIDAHEPEMPTRFAKQLTQLVRGAIAIGMRRHDALRLAIRCARDSMPPLRLEILEDQSTRIPVRAP